MKLTLVIIHNDSQILLGAKKRGFGEEYVNGFGGKVKENETIEQAAKRELYEEAGIEAELEKMGEIEFEFESKPELLEVHFYRSNAFSGEPTESEEMRPRWYPIDEIPYDKMWPDDPYWMPMLLKGEKFKGKFLFDENHKILDWKLEEVKGI